MGATVKQMLQNGQYVKGCFVGIQSPVIVEMSAYAGFDFVIIDTEHGAMNPSAIEEMIRAANSTNISPIVRVGYNPFDIQMVLDCGAHGIQVPMVNTKEIAETIVEKAKYPPLGKRGTAYSIRSAKYGTESGRSYLDKANRETFIAVHIESYEAVENIEEIMSVPGIDLCFLGPTDLSVSMGYVDEGASHPEVKRAMDHVLKVGQEKGIRIGKYVPSGSQFQEAYDWGAHYAAIGTSSIIAKALKEEVSKISVRN